MPKHLNNKFENLEQERKSLQETNNLLRTSLNNYVNSLLEILIKEQESFDVSKDNLNIYLGNQKRTVDNLIKELGEILDSNHYQVILKIKDQINHLQIEQLKSQFQTQIQLSPK